LLEMIEKPAALVGLRFQERLVKRILEETGSGPGALALMAFAMRELYKNRDPDGVMSFKAYDCFGGVSRAIGVRAEEEFEKLDSEAQAALPHVFRELIQVNESGTATRQRAPFDRMTRFPAAARLIHAFVNARLLVTSDVEGPSSSLEVAHEAILLIWPRLNRWILDTYDFHHLRRQIKQAASYWKDHGSRPETRWPDIRITEVSQMLERLKLNAQDLTEVERDYLGPCDRDEMLTTVYNRSTSHEEREIIGRRLSIMGDMRAGVGLKENGLPDIEWCRVPGGLVTFSSNNRVSHSESFTFHVCPFLISRYPITYLQYRTFLEAPDGFSNKSWLNGLSIQQLRYSGQASVYDNYPADCICWFEAVAFSRWFSHRLGYYVRLPTEFEWQQAATGGIPSNVYPWGSEWKSNCANTLDNGLNREMAVGLYPHGASPVGALDMSGTVWEWCLNEYERPYNTEVAGDFARTIRGGSWFLYREDATTLARDYHRPNPRGRNLGFRLAQPINDTRRSGAAA
jgi:Sulfatase-modifying factor enzyme 1